MAYYLVNDFAMGINQAQHSRNTVEENSGIFSPIWLC